ncbi:MAG: hypothetical protein WBW14_00150 [Candidatus Acidiferrum sp.]
MAIACYGGSHVSWIIPTQEKCAWQRRKRRAPASERSGNLQCRPYSSELYALHADYITKDENNPLVANWREIWLSRAHSMLIQANEKLALLEQYIDSDFKLRVARLFADLSTFMLDKARDEKRLGELASEQALIAVQLRQSLVKT